MIPMDVLIAQIKNSNNNNNFIENKRNIFSANNKRNVLIYKMLKKPLNIYMIDSIEYKKP